jgi:hypothetical protein
MEMIRQAAVRQREFVHGLDWTPVAVECPCGRVRVVLCAVCSAALVMVVDCPPCRHAVNLVAARS